MSRRLKKRAIVACIATIATCNGYPARAQVSAPEELEEIIVTATKRVQPLQDVPVAVTAVTGEQLSGAGVVDTERLGQVAPSLMITSSQQVGLGAQIRIRGIGTPTGNPGLEGSVGYFVDGIYVGRSNTAFTDLVDVERVEVLRGPQGTLFGKNTSAGVISVTTRAPEFEFGGNLRATATNLEGRRVSGRITGPIADDVLAFSVSAQGNFRDGYMRDVASGARYNDRDRWLVRGQMLYKPVEDFSVRLIAEHSERGENSTVPSFTQIATAHRTLMEGLGASIPTPPGGDDRFDTAVNAPFTANTNDDGITVQADWKTSFADIRALLGYRSAIAVKNWDSDLTNLDVYRQYERIKDDFYSAEFQLSRSLESVDLLAGLYYFDAETRYLKSQQLGADAGRYFAAYTRALIFPSPLVTASLWEAGRGLTAQNTSLDGDGWSAFTHNIWHVTSWLELTGGLRYQSEDKEGGASYAYSQASACTQTFTGTGSATANAILTGLRPSSICAAFTPAYQARYDDDQVTGVIIASVRPSSDVLIYASYANGFKAGGVNLDTRAGANASQTFQPETVDAYEVGLKSTALGGALTFNAAAFDMKFKDFQVNSFNPTSAFVLTNEASAESYGLEGELALRVDRGLWVRSGVLWNIAQYGKDTADANLRGRQVSNAPRLSGTFSVSFRQPVVASQWGVTANFDARMQGGMNTASNLDDRSRQKSYGLINARAGLFNDDNGMDVAVFANNIGNVRYKTIGFAVSSGYMSYWGDPRIIGIELTKRW